MNPLAYCTTCKIEQPVRVRKLAVNLMICKGCGNWIKCVYCMSIKTVRHVCAQAETSVPE
jgi:hypothetical protein